MGRSENQKSAMGGGDGRDSINVFSGYNDLKFLVHECGSISAPTKRRGGDADAIGFSLI